MGWLPYREWQRREDAFMRIALDGAITTRQLMRQHGLRSSALGDRVKRVERDVKVTASTRRPTRVTFLTTDLMKLGGVKLREYALLAEIRAVLKAPLHEWETPYTDPDKLIFRGGTSEPDALWRQRHKPLVAIEADAGAYSSKRVMAKAEAFAEVFSKQIWGCLSERRQESLVGWLSEVGVDFEVEVANPFAAVEEEEPQAEGRPGEEGGQSQDEDDDMPLF